MASVTLSANLDEKDARRLKAIAARENRSVSNVMANAALVFAALPKDVRDMLVELAAAPDRAGMAEVARGLKAVAASRRFEEVAARVAAQGRFDGDPDASDLELLEEATSMTRGL